jgi:ribonuclease P protein component
VLGADQRLRRSHEFAAIIRAGRRARRGEVIVHAARLERCSGTKAGFVVSRAVGNAVTRNLVRRRLRHLVRPLLVDLPPGIRVVVRALPGAADATFDQLGTDLDAALAVAVRQAVPRTRGGDHD